jgi:hypothetical protein
MSKYGGQGRIIISSKPSSRMSRMIRMRSKCWRKIVFNLWKKLAGLPAVPVYDFSGSASRTSAGLTSQLQKSMPVTMMINDNSEFDLDESDFNNIDKNEQKVLYHFKMRMLENEERRAREVCQVLDKKVLLSQWNHVHTRRRIFQI